MGLKFAIAIKREKNYFLQAPSRQAGGSKLRGSKSFYIFLFFPLVLLQIRLKLFSGAE
jgi:hypothetical protein